MQWSRACLLTIAVATALALAACGGSSPASCAQGTERCPCFGNSTCNSGLTCASNTCVNLGGAGGTTGSAGTGGATGSGGTVGSSKGGSGGTSAAGTGGTNSAGAGGTSAAGMGGTAAGGTGGARHWRQRWRVLHQHRDRSPELRHLRPRLQGRRVRFHTVLSAERLLRRRPVRCRVLALPQPGPGHELRRLLREHRRDLCPKRLRPRRMDLARMADPDSVQRVRQPARHPRRRPMHDEHRLQHR